MKKTITKKVGGWVLFLLSIPLFFLYNVAIVNNWSMLGPKSILVNIWIPIVGCIIGSVGWGLSHPKKASKKEEESCND